MIGPPALADRARRCALFAPAHRLGAASWSGRGSHDGILRRGRGSSVARQSGDWRSRRARLCRFDVRNGFAFPRRSLVLTIEAPPRSIGSRVLNATTKSSCYRAFSLSHLIYCARTNSRAGRIRRVRRSLKNHGWTSGRKGKAFPHIGAAEPRRAGFARRNTQAWAGIVRRSPIRRLAFPARAAVPLRCAEWLCLSAAFSRFDNRGSASLRARGKESAGEAEPQESRVEIRPERHSLSAHRGGRAANGGGAGAGRPRSQRASRHSNSDRCVQRAGDEVQPGSL